jgi:hypothetical protein
MAPVYPFFSAVEGEAIGTGRPHVLSFRAKFISKLAAFLGGLAKTAKTPARMPALPRHGAVVA